MNSPISDNQKKLIIEFEYKILERQVINAE